VAGVMREILEGRLAPPTPPRVMLRCLAVPYRTVRPLEKGDARTVDFSPNDGGV